MADKKKIEIKHSDDEYENKPLSPEEEITTDDLKEQIDAIQNEEFVDEVAEELKEEDSEKAKVEEQTDDSEEPESDDEIPEDVSESERQNQDDISKDDDASEGKENSEESESEEDPAVETDKEELPEDNESSETDEHPEDIDKSQTVGEAMDSAEEKESEKSETEEDIDKAVDDIVRAESDETIAEADAKLEALQARKEKRSLKQKIAAGLSAWWNNVPARYGTLSALLVVIVLVALLPTTRYASLNLLGIRVSSSMAIVDAQTRLPLKNINVSLQDKTAVTDADGRVSFDEMKLGKSSLVITKRGYADIKREIVLGWGSNPIGEQELLATGERFTFVLSDWQNGNPITEAEATAGENNALADEGGKIILTVGEEDISAVTVEIAAQGYRTEKLTSDQLPNGDAEIKMVPSKQHVFVSNRDGEYDLYKIDADQKHEQILLKATGNEREVPAVMPHPTRDFVAFVSSRDGDTNDDGFVLDGLFIIDVKTGESKRIARSEQLQLIGWSGDKLIFWQVIEGTSRANPERSKIISYDQQTSERTDLAAANYFNDVELVGDSVIYAVSSFAVPQSQAKLYRVGVSGGDSVKLIDKQVWSVYRTAHNRLLFNAEDQKWYERQGEGLIEEVANQTNPQDIDFVDSPDGSVTAWVEIRDGKGVLLVSATDKTEEKQLVVLPGLSEVLYWQNDSAVVFRVISNTETADYLVDTVKGEAVKITDVSATRNRYF